MKRTWMVGMAMSLAVVALLFASGCSKEDATAKSVQAYGPVTAPKAKFHSHSPGYTNWWVEWSKDLYRKSYEQAGIKDPKWDDEVRSGLDQYAYTRVYGKMPEGASENEMRDDFKRAVESGCGDPFVLYLYNRMFVHSPENATHEIAVEYGTWANGMEASGYPPLLKFYVNLRAAQAYRASSTRQAPEVNEFRRHAMGHIQNALCSAPMPAGAAADACVALYDVIGANFDQRADFVLGAAEVLEKRWEDEAFPYALKGRFYVDYAWEARGNGFADSVSKDGWKTFETRLNTAQKALEKAWKTDPSYAATPLQMMRVELGQGQGMERLETWFERAVRFPKNHYAAIESKLWYLQPRWFGSEEESLGFAREVVKSEVFKGQTPLHLYHTHVSLANYFKKERPKYWEEPQVWPDIRASFERYFELVGDDPSWRHNYALCAYRCHQWKAFLAETGKLKEVNYLYFGGKEKYAEMIAEAGKLATK